MDKVLAMILGVFGAPDTTDCRHFNAHTYFIGCEHQNSGGDTREVSRSHGSLDQPSKGGDKDKGHGNDPGRSDPDNPGKGGHGSKGNPGNDMNVGHAGENPNGKGGWGGGSRGQGDTHGGGRGGGLGGRGH